MKYYFTLFAIFIASISVAQFEYKPTEENPYGKPNPEAPEQIKEYAPLIGICDCKSESRKADNTWADPVNMTWTFKYIMNGMAIQDETLKEDGAHSGSIRQFNADSSKWYVHYYSTAAAPKTLSTWEGNATDTSIVLYKEQKAPNGMDGFFRLTFYDISENGYKWIGEWVDPMGKISFATWKIACIRRKE